MTDDENEDKLYFSPEQNNVIFASAVDGWGFGYVVSVRRLGFEFTSLDLALFGLCLQLCAPVDLLSTCCVDVCYRVGEFAAQYSSKLGIRPDILHKTLWGDFYLEVKTKRIKKGAQV